MQISISGQFLPAGPECPECWNQTQHNPWLEISPSCLSGLIFRVNEVNGEIVKHLKLIWADEISGVAQLLLSIEFYLSVKKYWLKEHWKINQSSEGYLITANLLGVQGSVKQWLLFYWQNKKNCEDWHWHWRQSAVLQTYSGTTETILIWSKGMNLSLCEQTGLNFITCCSYSSPTLNWKESQFVRAARMVSLSMVRLPTHMDGFLYPLGKIYFSNLLKTNLNPGNNDVYSYVSKPKTVVENYLKGDNHVELLMINDLGHHSER